MSTFRESENKEMDEAPALFSRRRNCTERICEIVVVARSDSSQVEFRRRHLAHDDGGRIRSRHHMHATRGWTTSDCASGCDGRDSPPPASSPPDSLVPPPSPRAGWRGAQPPSHLADSVAPCPQLFLPRALYAVSAACFLLFLIIFQRDHSLHLYCGGMCPTRFILKINKMQF
jgi:hypothetical protein